ncbi:MAG: sporulation membrane protein YtaF [Synechococcales cyanobacterium M58_A2018_015]|nr:sporulation membrane protein YtaF [Synechococcales cyanobacterium M58_A2018_015]
MPLSLLITPVLLALSVNIDSFAIAIAYGIKRLRIGLSTNLFIALVSAIGTFLSLSVGAEFAQALSAIIARDVGSLVLIAGGSWGIWQALSRQRRRRLNVKRSPSVSAASGVVASPQPSPQQRQAATEASPSPEFLHEFSYERFLDNPEKADRDYSGAIDVRESIALAFGLTLNNLTVGVGAGIAGFPANLTTLLTFVLSVLAITLGYRLGRQSRLKLSGQWAGLLSSLLILFTGLYEYFKP